MGFFSQIRRARELSRERPEETDPAARLNAEMEGEAAGFAAALSALGYRADGTVESLEELDLFFEAETVPNGILTGACEGRLKGLAAYLGEAMRRAWGGAWEDDGRGGALLRLGNGAVRDPFFTVMHRWKAGGEPFAAYAVRSGQSGD